MNLSSQDLSQFFDELQGLVRAGVPLGEDLSLHAKSDNRRVRRLWSRIESALIRGTRLSAALADASPQISEATLTLIRAGEESGDLVGVLEAIALGHRRRIGLERTLRLALIYPCLILVFMLGLLIFFGKVIVPTYELMENPAARHTAALMSVSMVTPSIPPTQPLLTSFPAMRLSMWMATPWGIGLTIGLVVALTLVFNRGMWLHPWFQRRVIAWLPVVGPLVNLGALSRWSHTMAHLLERRVSLSTALHLCESTLALPRLRVESGKVRTQIDQGIPLSMALMGANLLPHATAGLLAHGEKRGDIETTLERLGKHFDDRLDHGLRKIEAWLEPVLVLFTGLLVLALIVSLYAPILVAIQMGNFAF